MPSSKQIGDSITIGDTVFTLTTSEDRVVTFIGKVGDEVKHQVCLYDKGRRLQVRTDGSCFDFRVSEVKSLSLSSVRNGTSNIYTPDVAVADIQCATYSIWFKTHTTLFVMLQWITRRELNFNAAYDHFFK